MALLSLRHSASCTVTLFVLHMACSSAAPIAAVIEALSLVSNSSQRKLVISIGAIYLGLEKCTLGCCRTCASRTRQRGAKLESGGARSFRHHRNESRALFHELKQDVTKEMVLDAMMHQAALFVLLRLCATAEKADPARNTSSQL